LTRASASHGAFTCRDDTDNRSPFSKDKDA